MEQHACSQKILWHDTQLVINTYSYISKTNLTPPTRMHHQSEHMYSGPTVLTVSVKRINQEEKAEINLKKSYKICLFITLRTLKKR